MPVMQGITILLYQSNYIITIYQPQPSYKHKYLEETQCIDPRTMVEATESKIFPAGCALTYAEGR